MDCKRIETVRRDAKLRQEALLYAANPIRQLKAAHILLQEPNEIQAQAQTKRGTEYTPLSQMESCVNSKKGESGGCSKSFMILPTSPLSATPLKTEQPLAKDNDPNKKAVTTCKSHCSGTVGSELASSFSRYLARSELAKQGNRDSFEAQMYDAAITAKDIAMAPSEAAPAPVVKPKQKTKAKAKTKGEAEAEAEAEAKVEGDTEAEAEKDIEGGGEAGKWPALGKCGRDAPIEKLSSIETQLKEKDEHIEMLRKLLAKAIKIIGYLESKGTSQQPPTTEPLCRRKPTHFPEAIGLLQNGKYSDMQHLLDTIPNEVESETEHGLESVVVIREEKQLESQPSEAHCTGERECETKAGDTVASPTVRDQGWGNDNPINVSLSSIRSPHLRMRDYSGARAGDVKEQEKRGATTVVRPKRRSELYSAKALQELSINDQSLAPEPTASSGKQKGQRPSAISENSPGVGSRSEVDENITSIEGAVKSFICGFTSVKEELSQIGDTLLAYNSATANALM